MISTNPGNVEHNITTMCTGMLVYLNMLRKCHTTYKRTSSQHRHFALKITQKDITTHTNVNIANSHAMISTRPN